MTLPSTGPISMSQVATELGISATGLSLNDSRVRALAGKPSGTISMSDLRGKSTSVLTVGSSTPSVTNYGYYSGLYGALTNTSRYGGTVTSLSYARWNTVPPYVWRIDLRIDNMQSTRPPLTLVIAGASFTFTTTSSGTNAIYQCVITEAQFNALPKSGTAIVIFPTI